VTERTRLPAQSPSAPLAPGALDACYRAHGAPVLRRARGLLRDEEEAREVLHEVFMSLLESPSQVRGGSALTTWLYSATTHACLNRLRNGRTRARLLAADEAEKGSRVSPSAERATILRDLLARVGPELAQVAVYYYADEMTHEEIATVLSCSRRHVGDLVAQLHEAVRRIEGTAGMTSAREES
jgi:RNA polymerase sigma factor (sigma-70 family)